MTKGKATQRSCADFVHQAVGSKIPGPLKGNMGLTALENLGVAKIYEPPRTPNQPRKLLPSDDQDTDARTEVLLRPQ